MNLKFAVAGLVMNAFIFFESLVNIKLVGGTLFDSLKADGKIVGVINVMSVNILDALIGSADDIPEVASSEERRDSEANPSEVVVISLSDFAVLNFANVNLGE